jgi:probable selenium-dependent hydroxylase accessory protein YqeC
MSHPTTLTDALALGSARVVAFTGGGGKTSAMFRLAHELADARVLVTTTTRIWAPRPEQAEVVVSDDLQQARARLLADWQRGVRALGTALGADGKLQGVPAEWVTVLATEADYVLVEADGAAGKPLTAPRAHEPVIPQAAALVIPLAGVDAVGAPLDAAHVHRVAEIAALTGLAQSEVLTATAVATILLSPHGNVKGAPAAARIVPLLNKVETAQSQRAARAVAAALLARGAERVLLTRLAADPPVVAIVSATRADVAVQQLERT